MVVVGVGKRGAPRLSIPRSIALEDALVVGNAAKSEWEHALLVGVLAAHCSAASGDGDGRWGGG